jgi:hypothetical protein
MTSAELYDRIKPKIPAQYIYISENLHVMKGVPLYLISFNSRIPNTKISRSTVKNQFILKAKGLFGGNHLLPLSFSPPILLEEFTRPIRPNSIMLFLDLAGTYVGHDNTL